MPTTLNEISPLADGSSEVPGRLCQEVRASAAVPVTGTPCPVQLTSRELPLRLAGSGCCALPAALSSLSVHSEWSGLPAA